MGWWSFALIFSLYFFCGACKEIGKCFPHSMLLLLTFVCLSLLLLFCFAFTCSRNRRHIWFYLHGFLLHLKTCYGISLPKIWQYRNPSKNRGYTWAHVEFLKVFRQKCQAHNLKVVGSNPTPATIKTLRTPLSFWMAVFCFSGLKRRLINKHFSALVRSQNHYIFDILQ